MPEKQEWEDCHYNESVYRHLFRKFVSTGLIVSRS